MGDKQAIPADLRSLYIYNSWTSSPEFSILCTLRLCLPIEGMGKYSGWTCPVSFLAQGDLGIVDHSPPPRPTDLRVTPLRSSTKHP